MLNFKRVQVMHRRPLGIHTKKAAVMRALLLQLKVKISKATVLAFIPVVEVSTKGTGKMLMLNLALMNCSAAIARLGGGLRVA